MADNDAHVDSSDRCNGHPTEDSSNILHTSVAEPIGHVETLSELLEAAHDPSLDADEIDNLAESILKDCKKTSPISSLETALYLLHEARGLRPGNTSSNYLALSLVAKFIWTDQVSGLDEAIKLKGPLEICQNCGKPHEDDVSDLDLGLDAGLENEDAFAMTTFALATMADFCQATPISSIDSAIFLFRQAVQLRGLLDTKRPVSVCCLADALLMRGFHTHQHADLEEALSLLREALRLPSISYVDQSRLVERVSAALLTRFCLKGQKKDLAEAVGMRALQSKPPFANAEALDLAAQAIDILNRSQPSVNMTDLDTAATFLQQALGMLRTEDPKYMILANLANVHSLRYNHTGFDSDFRDSIALNEEVLRLLSATHPTRTDTICNMASTFCTKFEKTSHADDLEKAVLFSREAFKLLHPTHRGYSAFIHRLISLLGLRFHQKQQVDDLEGIISLWRDALRFRPAPDPDRWSSLDGLGRSLWERFQLFGNMEDIEEAIHLHRDALHHYSSDSEHWSSLNNLAVGVGIRFEQKGNVVDLEEEIFLHRQALMVYSAAPSQRLDSLVHIAAELSTLFIENRTNSLNNLAAALWVRFKHQGHMNDLEEAVALHREALGLASTSHPDHSDLLNNLAKVLLERFKRQGHMDDLEEATLLSREALITMPALYHNRSNPLTTLANILAARFQTKGQEDDLTEAISLQREALTLCPPAHHSFLKNNLATTLLTRFERKGREYDLVEAVSLNRQALALLPATHSARHYSLNNLAHALSTQFRQTDLLHDLEEAISAQRDAMIHRPAPDPENSVASNNLASLLVGRFWKTDQVNDLEEALVHQQGALTCLPPSHPARCLYSSDLALYLCLKSKKLSDRSLLDTAMDSFRIAVSSEPGSVLDRLTASKEWADLADGAKHASALEAYQAVIKLLPQVAMLASDMNSRHRLLADHLGRRGVASKAAACAISSGDLELAVEMLEEGRSIFWSQALQLRTPFDGLRLDHPKLSQKLQEISRALERSSFHEGPDMIHGDARRVMTMEAEAARFRQLNEDWLATLDQVRALEGFEFFMRPKKFGLLKRAADHGPVVLLNATATSCDALVITSTGIEHVPLSTQLTGIDIAVLANSVHCAATGRFITFADDFRTPLASLVEKAQVCCDAATQDRPLGRRTRKVQSIDDIFRGVLATLWTLLVQPVIRCLKLEKSGNPPRVWWCPTGPFAFLPIHAAGIYDTSMGTPENASDYIVSSYTPTLNTLLAPRHPPNADSFKMLVAIQPQTAGQAPLTQTREEMRQIERHVPAASLIKLGSSGSPPATSDMVVSQLRHASIAHFACHGIQNASNSLESALLLDDGPWKVSRIMAQSLPNASLAFLSACQTAMGDMGVPDEAMHLAATMSFAGFRGVVATMWSIYDADGPKIANEFYGHLFQGHEDGSAPDTTQAARALHLAVKKLREEHNNRQFVRWVPFVHYGL